MKYNHVVLGGTFDLLHLGHQSFLNKAFNLGQFVTIGLTTDKFNKFRGKPSFEDQNLRLKNLKVFLTKKNYLKRSKIVFINDIFGTTLDDPSLEAIVVTSKTKRVVDLINQKRADKHLNKLEIITMPFVQDQTGQIISSSRIRQGEINTLGQSYRDLLLKVAGKKLSQTARAKLKKPLGQLLSNPPSSSVALAKEDNHPYITVGDATTANFLKAGLSPKLAIVDAKVGRQANSVILNEVKDLSRMRVSNKLRDSSATPQNDRVIKIKNPPGQISRSLILAINKALKKILPPEEGCVVPSSKFLVLFVAGEEDLATIPAILLSPLGTTVYYGQPNKGLVEVKVDLKIKDHLCKILALH